MVKEVLSCFHFIFSLMEQCISQLCFARGQTGGRGAPCVSWGGAGSRDGCAPNPPGPGTGGP